MTLCRVLCRILGAMLLFTQTFGDPFYGSPFGAVGPALRAINEVKLDRARLLLGWVTRLTVSIGLWLWADQLRS